VRSRTNSLSDYKIEDMDNVPFRSSSGSRSHSNTADRRNPPDFSDSPDEIHYGIHDGIDSPEPAASGGMLNWIYRLMSRLSRNCSHYFGIVSCLTARGDDVVEQKHPGKCAEITAYSFAFASLAALGTAVMCLRISIYDDEAPTVPARVVFPVPALESSAPYLIPAAVFVYSFILSWDRRPRSLVKLFSNMIEIRDILTQEQGRITPVKKESKYETEQASGNDCHTPLLNPAPKNLGKIRKFAGLLSEVIDRDGPIGQWFYHVNQTGNPIDKWRNMRVFSLFMKTRSPLCGLHSMPEFDIKECKEIKGNAVILTDDHTAYFILNDKIVMQDGKPRMVEGINRQNIAWNDSESKKWQIIKEAAEKGGYLQQIIGTIRDQDKRLITRLQLQQQFRYEHDYEILNIISTSTAPRIEKEHLEALHDMIGALLYANENSYLSLPLGLFAKWMNRNTGFRWSVFLFVAGSMVTTVMMPLNLGNIATRFIDRFYDGNSLTSLIKANNNLAIIILVSPITPGILALWAKLNTIPVFDVNAQLDTLTKRLFRWISNYNTDNMQMHIKGVINLSILGIALGLLIAQPKINNGILSDDPLNNGVLLSAVISYYVAKPFAMIPGWLRKNLPERFRFFSANPSRSLNSSMERSQGSSHKSIALRSPL
jgi:hypothetical protein